MAFVRFGHGSKILPKKLLYFPPDMTTPISMDHQKLCRYTVAATVSIEASNEQFSKLRMEEDNDYQIQRCGKIITTALLVNAGVNNDFKKQAKVQNAIITWKNEGEVTAMKAVIPDSADQFGSLGQAYSRGGLITIRNTETFPNKPCNMLIGEVNFDENEQSCIITARAPTSEVKKTLDPTGSGEITLSVVLTPAKDLIIGRDLANKMMKNELRMLHPGMPEAPKAIFKAVLGIPLEAVPQAKHTEPEIPEFLTDDQKSIIKATIIGEAPIIPVEAIAGSGKSTTLCWTVKLYRKAHPKLVAVITSTGNAPVLHVAEYFQDEIENPPLVLASLISTRKLDNENKERLKAFSLLSHIQYVLENCPISDPQKRSLQRALELEKAVEAEVKNPEADENDAMQNEGLFVEDLLPQVEEGDQENDDEPENAEEPQQEVHEEATTLKKKKITRSGSIRKAIKIIIQYRPPCCIAGTTVMIMRIGAALRGVCKCLFVDEAATVYQLHLLNMLAEISSVEKLVLVGDTKQLTVYSRGIHKAVKKMGFESALEVLQDLHCSGIEKMALTTCFRSHPQLLDMIQATCYPEYELTTPVSPEEREGMKRIFGVTMPFFFLNVEGDDEQHYPVSRKNMHQHAALLQILTRLRKEGTVAVISLYAGQKHITFASVKDDKDVVAATVDSYQGSEADFVVVMTTKTTNAMKNEFVNNEQRKTVAITRARKGLIIIGNQKALINSTAWGPLIDYISQHQMIFQEIPQPTSRTLVIDGMPGLSIDSPPTLPYTEPQQQANEQPMEH
uniref:DNA2/NAM7 helicase-like C-terminal domain-containing protein n=1 Tax=Panagrolaimus superbus TaxID=310955 RepID=A0A914Z7Z3_9BILA